MTKSEPAQNSALKQRIAEASVEGRVGIAPGLAQPGNLGAQMALAPVGAVPPFRERVGVVRAADRHRFGGEKDVRGSLSRMFEEGRILTPTFIEEWLDREKDAAAIPKKKRHQKKANRPYTEADFEEWKSTLDTPPNCTLGTADKQTEGHFRQYMLMTKKTPGSVVGRAHDPTGEAAAQYQGL